MAQTQTAQDDVPEKTKPTVLELRDVTFVGKSENSVRLSRTSLVVREGELVVVHLDPLMESREIVSMLQGLGQPSGGEVLFQNQTWTGEDCERQFRMRSRIGRVFEGQAWIENLNVDENVTLASLHHGATAESVQQSAAYWASHLGLSGLSRKRPAFLEPSLLQLHQWIRAFIGKPALVILERPMRLVSNGRLPKLMEAVEELRRRGASVLWLTSNRSLASASFAAPTVQLELQNNKLVQIKGESRHE